MKQYSLVLTMIACLQSAIALADYVPSTMPQGTPPVINDQTKQLILNQIQASSSKAATATASTPATTASTAAPSMSALPANLPTALYNNSPSSANLDNQRAYQAQIKQYLQTQKR